MRFIHHISLFTLASLTLMSNVFAVENVGQTGKKTSLYSNNRAADCTAPTSNYDLTINNVRARIMNGGDMWWDLSGEALYNVPKDGGVSSLFAGAIWIGGVDAGGQLKVAAQTYRQSGTDFYAGPLKADGTTDDATCKAFDDHYPVLSTEVQQVIDAYEEKGSLSPGDIPESVLKWPAKGNNAYNSIVEDYSLAPFFDRNGDDVYNPLEGDYPILDLGTNAEDVVVPDEMVWWVYNDKGNIHGETGSEAIGIEIQATAFAFQTNDEINDMTFYRYKITNKSSIRLNDTYMAQWVDADLGYAFDDFVGCDTTRELGICYNGDAEDGPAARSYGTDLPMVGVDFFQGPIDTAGNELGMAVFLYYNNDPSTTGNPRVAPDYYGYLSGFWKDGTPFTSGGNGYGGSELSNYIFPGDPSDNNGWSECSQNNTPADRRFLQSAGPFVLEPGAVNNVTIGVVWVQQKNASRCSSFKPLQAADDKAQALFKNNFKLLEGPKMPGWQVRELDEEIVLTISDYNETESYFEVDPFILALRETDSTIVDTAYKFQGYIIYQLANKDVSSAQLNDPTLARVLANYDVQDGVGQLVNFSFDTDLEISVGEVKAANATDEGVRHSISIKSDLFASGSSDLINHKDYYFAIMPYGYNRLHNYKDSLFIDGLTSPYIEARIIDIPIKATPKPTPANTTLNAEFGDGPQIIKLEGGGNAGNELELTEESIASILSGADNPTVTYKTRKAPIDVYVYDPINVKPGTYSVVINHVVDTIAIDSNTNPPTITYGQTSDDTIYVDSTDMWSVIYDNGTTTETIHSDTFVGYYNEQVLPEHGIIVKVNHIENAAATALAANTANPVISASIEFEDVTKFWLAGVQDERIFGLSSTVTDWIRSGKNEDSDYDGLNDNQSGTDWLDGAEHFEGILDGAIAPYALANYRYYYTPNAAPTNFNYVLAPGLHRNNNATVNVFSANEAKLNLEKIRSIDFVFTDDKTKWTECLVLEAQDEEDLSADGVSKLSVRTRAGLSLDSVEVPSKPGYSYFPGYAIDVETGKRLNILFAEDTWLASDNGNDMVFNPSNRMFEGQLQGITNYKFGGKHYVYVMSSEYSSGKLTEYKSLLDNGDHGDVFMDAMWTMVPMLNSGFQYKSYADGLIPTPTTIKLRVNNALFEADDNGDGNAQVIYQFNTDSLVPFIDETASADTAILNHINVVPNPYYAYSEYETSQLNNRIKITNLPNECTISIYSINGSFIRKFNRSVSADDNGNTNTTLEWDLKNQAGIMVASGVYLIHVDVPNVGKRTLKWFGVMRPLDLDSF